MRFVGVDGGGTRTRALLLDDSGRMQGWTVGGPGNFQLLGLDGVEALVDDLLAGLPSPKSGEPTALCLALAGAGRPSEQAEIEARIGRRGWCSRVMAVSDARAALEGGLGGRCGLIVISGTGSIVLGRNEADDEARAGGWGPLLDDEGSGYSLGLEALRAVFRARDGWGPPTSLTESLLEALHIAHWDELIVPLYAGDLGRDRIAALAPVVLQAAARGDEAAAQIVAEGGGCLGRKAAAVAQRLRLAEPVTTACTGGILEAGEQMWEPIAQGAEREGIVLHLQKPLLPPVVGAVLLAWRLTGRQVDEALMKRLTCASTGLA